MNTFDL